MGSLNKMASKAVKEGFKLAKPVLSVNKSEAKRRVINLYKAWYRQMEFTVKDFELPVTVEEGREKIREQFRKNKHVTDIRAIDMMVIKGQQELLETAHIWKQENHVMAYFKDTVNKKPNDFLGKFYDGHD